MPAISSAQHIEFCDFVQQQLQMDFSILKGKQYTSLDLMIKENMQLLESLFAEYQLRVKDLYELIEQYEEVKKQARIQVRKRYNKNKSLQELTSKKVVKSVKKSP